MDTAALELAIAKGALKKPFLLFAGREEFLKERATAQLVEKYVPAEDRTANVMRIDLGSSSVEDFTSKLNTFSFNSSHRIFVLDKPENLAASARRNLLKQLSGAVLPDNVFILVISDDAKTIGEFALELNEKAEKVDFWPPFENKLPEWLQKEAGRFGKKLAQNAIDILLEKIGPDLRMLSKELEKICLASGQTNVVTAEFVSKSISYLRQESVFDLLEAIGMRSLPKALRMIESLLSRGESPIGIWYMLSRMLRDFKLLHDIAADRPDLARPLFEKLNEIRQLHGKSDFVANQKRKNAIETIQKETGNWPPLLVDVLGISQTAKIKTLATALNFSKSELKNILSLLLKTDTAIKNSPPNEAFLLQETIVAVITGRL